MERIELHNVLPTVFAGREDNNSEVWLRQVTLERGKYYLIIDPWGNPYRYRLGYELEDEKGKTGPGINPDFDIFSQGPDGLGQGKTNADEDADNVTNIRSWK